MTGNPLLDLRRLDEEKRQKKAPQNDEMMKSSNDGGNDEMMKSSQDTSQQPSKPHALLSARRPVKRGGRPQVKEGNMAGTSPPRPVASHTDSYEAVKGRVTAPASKEAVTRLNLDMPEVLHDRMRLYCAHRKIKIRELVCALVEDFLNHEDAEG